MKIVGDLWRNYKLNDSERNAWRKAMESLRVSHVIEACYKARADHDFPPKPGVIRDSAKTIYEAWYRSVKETKEENESAFDLQRIQEAVDRLGPAVISALEAEARGTKIGAACVATRGTVGWYRTVYHHLQRQRDEF